MQRIRMSAPWRAYAIFITALVCTAVSAQEFATTNRDSQLRASAGADAAIVQALPRGTEIEVVERQGAFTRVRVQGKVGFVQVFHFTPKVVAEAGTASARGSNSGTRPTAATVGVRGLTKDDFEKIEPNPERYDRYSRLAVSSNAGANFASRYRLNSNSTPFYKKDAGSAFVPIADLDFSSGAKK
jgi:hypothetical protein